MRFDESKPEGWERIVLPQGAGAESLTTEGA